MESNSPLELKSYPRKAQKCRVAHVIATNFYGGPEKQIIEHLKRLNTSIYSGIIFSFIEGGRENELLRAARDAGIEHHGILMAGPLDVFAWRRFKKLVQRSAVGLLCVHGYKSTVMGAWIHKILKVPTLAFSRGYTNENLKIAFYQYLDRLALGYINGVICVSEGQRRRLESLGVYPKRIWVIPNAVQTPNSTNDFQPIRSQVFRQFGLPDNTIMCVSAGRLSPEKGHKDLLEAIATMRERADGCCFMFCGDGICRKKLEKQARELRIEARVRFVGFRKDIEDIFKAMDLLVLPSHTEGLPNVILEAFSLGKPVVATLVGGIPEVVENERNGLLVPPEDAQSLAEAVFKCIADPAMRESLGKEARLTVQSRFSFEEQTRRLESVYREFLLPPKID